MESFSVNTAKSLLGKNVNLHLKDGSVIVNVLLAEIKKDNFQRNVSVKCVPYGNKSALTVPLKSVAWAELLNLDIILAGD